MHDFLEYMKLDPYFRKNNHNKMTFGLTYFTSENYILVLSHDEVVHLKCSMINKMPGIYEDKFSNLKCGYTYMIGHPGKKLLFMGQEFAQWHEWNENVSLSWELLDEPLHKDMQNFVRGLLHLYKEHPCLYSMDDNWNGFQWINANDADRSIFSFVRYDAEKKKSLLFAINFTPMERSDYTVGVPFPGTYKLVLDETVGNYKMAKKKPVSFKAFKGECDGQPYHVYNPMKPYGIQVYEFDEPKKREAAKDEGAKPAKAKAPAAKAAKTAKTEKTAKTAKTTKAKTAAAAPAKKRAPRKKKEEAPAAAPAAEAQPNTTQE